MCTHNQIGQAIAVDIARSAHRVTTQILGTLPNDGKAANVVANVR